MFFAGYGDWNCFGYLQILWEAPSKIEVTVFGVNLKKEVLGFHL